jgi:hypothetical protein
VPSAPPQSIIEDAYHDAGQARHAYYEFTYSQVNAAEPEHEEAAPAYQRNESLAYPEPPTESMTEDKQELERRRLQQMTSSPDDGEDEDEDYAESSSRQAPLPIPSAPVFDDEEDEEFPKNLDPQRDQEYRTSFLPGYRSRHE